MTANKLVYIQTIISSYDFIKMLYVYSRRNCYASSISETNSLSYEQISTSTCFKTKIVLSSCCTFNSDCLNSKIADYFEKCLTIWNMNAECCNNFRNFNTIKQFLRKSFLLIIYEFLDFVFPYDILKCQYVIKYSFQIRKQLI